MILADGVIAPFDAQPVSQLEDRAPGDAGRRLERVGGQLQQEPVGIAKVERVHESAVDATGIRESQLFQPSRRAVERFAGNRVGDVVNVADDFRHRRAIGRPPLANKEGDQVPIAGVEVEMGLLWYVEIRLLEDERHTEHTLVEVDRVLPVRADQGDVVHAGRRDLHRILHAGAATPASNPLSGTSWVLCRSNRVEEAPIPVSKR